MMEKTDTGEAHDHIMAVAGFDDVVISDAAAGLRYIFNAAAESSFDVVTEGEEGVGAAMRASLPL